MARDTGGAWQDLIKRAWIGALMFWVGTGVGLADEVAVGSSSSLCLSDMTQARHVDKPPGNLARALAVAEAGLGANLPGSPLQLNPRHVSTSNVRTALFAGVDASGTTINPRRFAEANNGIGCDEMARPEFNMAGEQSLCCDLIPRMREIPGLQCIDSRCVSAEPVSEAVEFQMNLVQHSRCSDNLLPMERLALYG